MKQKNTSDMDIAKDVSTLTFDLIKGTGTRTPVGCPIAVF